MFTNTLLIEEICEIININLIFLPPYSPKLNPIEQVWRTVKRRISRYYYGSKETLKEQFHKIFYEIIEKTSFYEE
ncbi:MAG: transposase [Methanobacteriaceae archaeon]|nr:transposase [Methanobacteriaceae archaeon]